MATVAKVRLVSNIFRAALSKGSFDIYQYWLWITIILLSPPESKSTFSSTLNTWPPEGWTSFTRFGYTCRIACFGNGRWGWVTSSGGDYGDPAEETHLDQTLRAEGETDQGGPPGWEAPVLRSLPLAQETPLWWDLGSQDRWDHTLPHLCLYSLHQWTQHPGLGELWWKQPHAVQERHSGRNICFQCGRAKLHALLCFLFWREL